MAIWAYYSIRVHKSEALQDMISDVELMANTIRRGAHYAMLSNARDDISRIIGRVARQKEVESVRVINKEGMISFSNKHEETEKTSENMREICAICHLNDQTLETAEVRNRTRLLGEKGKPRRLGLISPIYNEPSCSTASCHVHPSQRKVLGLLDVVVSLDRMEQRIGFYKKEIIWLGVILFLSTATIIGVFIMRFVNRPIRNLMDAARSIGNGEYYGNIEVGGDDEISRLAAAINSMREMVVRKQADLTTHWHEYQNLFEGVPCYVTVQDRNLKILRCNREFQNRFSPMPGDYCYKAYKGRSERCEICPIIRTFEDGLPHVSEEAALGRDGTESYWMVRTSPITNVKGEVVAAMEMSLDLTHVRLLEREAKRSEEKYRTIFDTIPNPVFVLDAETLEILDCNRNVAAVYGFRKEDLLGVSFGLLFQEKERAELSGAIRSSNVIDRAVQVRKDGQAIYVTVSISSSEYAGREVFLVTTSDITMQLMAEQQLIQASKMATLGEMAAGVAHELNQPLSVIKTASSFISRKIAKKEPIGEGVLKIMSEEMDAHADRAEKIINHMREFGRKSDIVKEKVQVNEVLGRALDFFRQQLKLRKIEVTERLEKSLPSVLADGNRLEQVFVNLLLNARDAIEKKWEDGGRTEKLKKIVLETSLEKGLVTIRVTDNGTGMPDSIRDKIFEPFFTTKKVGKGTGLGLSISYSIVRDYHGAIEVKSREGEGSTFVVQFPCPKEA